uniref:phosphotransferase family protein n=1 Tax=uncultured Sphingomonas sp. TaxID=158754 RepID=UPI0035CA63DA
MRDLDQIAVVLRKTLPQGYRIAAVRPLTAGYSNETYVIEGLDLILRMPPASGAMLEGRDVVGQARAYQELATITAAPPVPRIVTIEDDPTLLGAPFFVMERVSGDTIDDIHMAPWFVNGTDALRNQTCERWISAFASLARIAPLPAFGAIVTPEDDVRIWREFARTADCPELVESYDRLLTLPAPRSGPPAVVHGDPKLANLMWQDGEITAMFDWEMALNGEPLADLGYMLFSFASEYHVATRAPKLPGMLSRDEVIALWSRVSGRSAEGVLWHEIAQCAKVAAIVAEGANMYRTGRSKDPKLLIFLDNLGYYLGIVGAMLDGGGFAAPKGTS